MTISTKALNTLTVFVIIFMIAMAVVQRVEHQEKMKSNKELIGLLENNNKLREKQINQQELILQLLDSENGK